MPRTEEPEGKLPQQGKGEGLGAISWCVEHQLGVALRDS